MLVVMPDIERDAIDRAVVAESLLVGVERVVLLHPARAHGMQPDGKEKRENEVTKSRPPAEVNHRRIVGDGANRIHQHPAVPHRDRLQPRRPRQLEKRKEKQPDRFAIPLVTDQARLPATRDIGVQFVVALVGVMLEMVNPEADRARHQIRQIGQNGDEPVQRLVPENEIVNRVVNHHVHAMVRERAHPVRDQQT